MASTTSHAACVRLLVRGDGPAARRPASQVPARIAAPLISVRPLAASVSRRGNGLVAHAIDATGPTRPVPRPAGVEEEEPKPKQEKKDPETDSLKMESWGQAVDAMKEKKTVTLLITRFNNAGFNGKAFGLTGFLPYSLVDPAKLPAAGASDAHELRKKALGTHMSVKVVEAEISTNRLIFSEIACSAGKALSGLKAGDVMTGEVCNVTDFGAFVNLKGSDGQLIGAQGMVHKSELSWEMIAATSDVVKPGQEVTVKVLDVDASANRLSLSMKACQDDPIQVNLDTMLPVDEDPSVNWKDSSSPLPGLDSICRELRSEDGILLVTPGRQAEVTRVVSQDLQIFLTKKQVADGYNLVARSGTRVQEVAVATDLSRDDMITVLTTVLQRIQNQ